MQRQVLQVVGRPLSIFLFIEALAGRCSDRLPRETKTENGASNRCSYAGQLVQSQELSWGLKTKFVAQAVLIISLVVKA